MTERRGCLPLPHAYPFLLIDRVIEIDPGRSARVVKCLARDDPLLDAAGCLPPVLLAEAIAQAAGIAAIGPRLGVRGVLARIDRFRSPRAIQAGDRVDIRVCVLKTFGSIVKARGVARVDGRIRAAGDVFLQLAGPV